MIQATQEFSEEELKLMLHPPCFGCFSEADSECDPKNCDVEKDCRNFQVKEFYEIEAAAIEYEEALKEEAAATKFQSVRDGNPLDGKKVAISGSLKIKEDGKQLAKSVLTERLKQRGAALVSPQNWSDEEVRPDFLVVSEDLELAGKKTTLQENAERYSVPVVKEEEFLMMYYHDKSHEELLELGIIPCQDGDNEQDGEDMQDAPPSGRFA